MISFDRLDLNLLRIFDAVMEERSVLRASQRLHLSQSAVSHALSRLRESVGEDLFIRTSNGMRPTDFAMEISIPLRAALQSMNGALSRAAPPFQPASIRKTFVLAANDYISAILLPHFNRMLSQCAPGIDLVIRPSTRLDLAEQIDLRRIDIAIGTFSSIPERLHSQLLIQQDEVLICWNEHPIATADISINDMANYPLAVVSLGGEEDGAVSGFILERGLARQSEMYDRQALDHALLQADIQIRAQMTIPHFLAIPSLLENSELTAIVPRPLAKAFSGRYPLAIRELPYPVGLQRVDIIWHSHNDLDPAHSWLRAQLCETARQIQHMPE